MMQDSDKMIREANTTQVSFDKKAYWLSIIAEWQNSGLTQKAFCETKAFAYTQFSYWRTRLNQTKQKTAGTLIPVHVSKKVPTTNLALELRSSKGMELSIPAHYPKETLSTVLQLLENCLC